MFVSFQLHRAKLNNGLLESWPAVVVGEEIRLTAEPLCVDETPARQIRCGVLQGIVQSYILSRDARASSEIMVFDKKSSQCQWQCLACSVNRVYTNQAYYRPRLSEL